MWISATYDLAEKRVKKVCIKATLYPGGVGLCFTDDPDGADLKIELKRKTAIEMVRALKSQGITA